MHAVVTEWLYICPASAEFKELEMMEDNVSLAVDLMQTCPIPLKHTETGFSIIREHTCGF